MLASAGIPSKFTLGEGMSMVAGDRPMVDWTAASPLNPWPAAAGPRSGRSRVPAPRLAAVACLATSRMGAETSKPAGAVNLGLEALAAACMK